MPGGPPPQCSSEGHNEPNKFQIGAGVGSLNSTLRFDDGTEAEITMNTVSLSASWRLNQTWSIRGGAGIILDGELSPVGDTTHEIQPGSLAALGVVYQTAQGGGARPYVDVSLFLSASTTTTRNPYFQSSTSYVSTDLRLAGRASWMVKDKLFPYIAANVFGGPVFWTLNGNDVTGSDIHHYQISIGSAVQLSGMTVFMDWAGIGENALSAGISYSL